MRQQLGSALTIVGAVVGAGFASGREVYYFFSRYGLQGLLGAILSIIILLIWSLRVLKLAQRYSANTFMQLLKMHFHPKAYQVLQVLMPLAMWLGLGVMLSGAGAAGVSLGIGKASSLIITSCLVAVCLYAGIEGVKNTNAILIPVLIAVTLVLFWLATRHGNYSFLMISRASPSLLRPLWSGVLYAGLNSLLVFVVIPPLSQSGGSTGILLGCLLFGALLLIAVLLLLQFPVLSAQSPLPMLSIAADVAPAMPKIYGAMLWTALTTTALANGLGLKDFLQSALGSTRLVTSIVIVLASLPIALISFEYLVAVAYTSLGYAALFVAIGMLRPSR